MIYLTETGLWTEDCGCCCTGRYTGPTLGRGNDHFDDCDIYDDFLVAGTQGHPQCQNYGYDGCVTVVMIKLYIQDTPCQNDYHENCDDY